jgi:hypothetical protein
MWPLYCSGMARVARLVRTEKVCTGQFVSRSSRLLRDDLSAANKSSQFRLIMALSGMRTPALAKNGLFSIFTIGQFLIQTINFEITAI